MGFAAGKRGTALAEREVTETAIDHQLADLGELGMEIEKYRGLVEREQQNLPDGFTFPGNVGEVRTVT